MEDPSTGTRWGLAAILGCGACCGGLAATATWAGATGATLVGLVSGWVWLAVAGVFLAGGVLLWRSRRA